MAETAPGSRVRELMATLPLREPGSLHSYEAEWRDRHPWLQSRGYLLRPRYRADWVPSWKGTDKFPMTCEDGISTLYPHVLDATRISDGKQVMLKIVSTTTHPYEVELCRYFKTEPLASHPKNHIFPILEIIPLPDDPNSYIIVMPLLRPFNSPPFGTVGEGIDALYQIFEGIQFMHQCHVAHRDCMRWNIMLDPSRLYPKGFHPRSQNQTKDFKSSVRHYNRTFRPSRYYLIDLGLSRRYDPTHGPPRDYPIIGGDKTVPEFRDSDGPYDPFPTDIYYLGNLIREHILQVSKGFEFVTPLMADMVQDDPSKRPTIDEVIARFDELCKHLPWWTLRSRLVYMNEYGLSPITKPIGHFFKTIGYLVSFRPAVPRH